MENLSAVIVEPDHLWRGLLFRHLDHAQGNFLFAPSAAIARRFILVRKPDLVVTEFNLPDYPGLEFIRQIRGLPGSAVKILVLSRDPNRRSLEQGLDLGVSSYIEKGSMPLPEIAASIISVLTLP